MRLWPYQMLEDLPTKQLVAQWRECLAISGMFARGKVNHAIINRVKDYPIEHFAAYCTLVREAFDKRGFRIGQNTINKLNSDIGYESLGVNIERSPSPNKQGEPFYIVNGQPLFESFHSKRYMRQCMYGFEERYDCGMITKEEYDKLHKKFGYLME